MRTFKKMSFVAIASVFALALAIDAADARRGGGGGGFSGGGMRGGGFSGGGMRAGGGGARFATGGSGMRPSHPIARPGAPGGGVGWGNRPVNRPGYGPGWGGGYRPGYGWGAAAAVGAVGAGLAYSAYNNGYYDPGYYDPGYYDPGYYDPGYVTAEPAAGSSDDAIAECARLFKTYDPVSQTYIKRKGVRASCP